MYRTRNMLLLDRLTKYSTSAANNSDVKDVVKPYDWTYSTDYKGTVLSDQQFEEADEPVIDVERLKKQEPILFYDENILYEDELADNGTTVLSVRLVRRFHKHPYVYY